MFCSFIVIGKNRLSNIQYSTLSLSLLFKYYCLVALFLFSFLFIKNIFRKYLENISKLSWCYLAKMKMSAINIVVVKCCHLATKNTKTNGWWYFLASWANIIRINFYFYQKYISPFVVLLFFSFFIFLLYLFRLMLFYFLSYSKRLK